MKRIFTTILLVLSCVLISQANAHHSTTATFTQDRNSTIEGVITEFKFRNPHVIIFIDVANDDGSVTNWMGEGHSATSWRRAGWDASVLNTGDKLRVSGDATIDGSPMVWLDEMEFLDPATNEVIAELSSASDPTVAFNLAAEEGESSSSSETVNETMTIPLTLSDGRPNFTGTTRRNNDFTRGGPDANDASMPYNEIGKAALEAWDLTQDPQIFCEPPGLVRQGGYTPYGQIIKQFDDRVEIEYEEYGGKRVIYFDQVLEGGEKSHLGDSVARYEGDTLIIESTNLLANASGHRGRPLSDEIRVTEVFSRVDDELNGSQLKIETTVHDPKFLTESWTISRTKRYDDSYVFIENECVPPIRAASIQ